MRATLEWQGTGEAGVCGLSVRNKISQWGPFSRLRGKGPPQAAEGGSRLRCVWGAPLPSRFACHLPPQAGEGSRLRLK